MANRINEEILTNVKELITKITQFEGGSEQFAKLEKCVLTMLKKSDTMYFLNTKDVKKAVWSMADKFIFHSFFRHAEYLKQSHDKYIDANLSESDLTPRLNVVKFLLCMSQNPTTHFWKDPDKFDFIQDKKDEEEVVDWGAYLNEGIERWSPVKNDSDSSDSDHEAELTTSTHGGGSTACTIIREVPEIRLYDFRASRTELLETIQNTWYNGKIVIEKPPSEWFDASVGILWEQHLQSQVQNLIEIEPVSVISEYKVMREIMWQMWGPHNSTVFQLQIDKLVPKSNVTISSVCSMTFENFLDVFVPYIEILDEFRQFYKLLDEPNVCETYRSYGCAVQKIMKLVFAELVEIEKGIRDQESTMTLLKLAGNFEKVFQPVYVLRTIHQEVILENFQELSPLECALTLLTRLRKSLEFSLNKLEQDICLTLYLESLYYYFTMTNAWLVKNDLFDHTQEFIILNTNEKNLKTHDAHHMNFFLQENVSKFCDEDAIIRLISDQVLQIGRNIHFLRLLGKYDVFAIGSESIHQEFVRRFLEELANYYGSEFVETEDVAKFEKFQSNFDLHEMGDWTSFVDLSDGFLAKAFDDFYMEKVENSQGEIGLFEKIDKITTNLFPLQGLPEKIFVQILKDRFTISGLMVKNLLIENYGLDKQFEFVNHTFLFWDDHIFPFYRRLFEKMNIANGNWGNSVWLTSHLQDTIMDMYPTFHEDCTVQVKEYWKQCRDSLEACTLLSLQYEIKWPLNIIITKEHIAIYKDIFQFILTLKWALYTINHLVLTDLEPRKSKVRAFVSIKLACLRFNLINILNTIQHYLFGLVFTKYRIQFELDFEKSNDLKSLISCHDDFVKSIHRSVVEIRDRKHNQHGFNTLMKSVKMLKVMWNGLQYATLDNLENCYKMYTASFDVVNAVVNPVFVFDN